MYTGPYAYIYNVRIGVLPRSPMHPWRVGKPSVCLRNRELAFSLSKLMLAGQSHRELGSKHGHLKSSHTQHQYQPAPNSSWLSSLEERNSLLLAVGQRKSLILKMLQLLQRCALGKHHSTLLQRLHPSQPTACISLHMPPGSCRDTHSRR